MKRQSFTLIELLLAIFVITILAAIGVGTGRLAWSKSEEAKIRGRMKTLEMALEQYRRDWGYFPYQETAGDFDILLYSPNEELYLDDQERLSDTPGNLPDYHEPSAAYTQSGPGSEPFQYEYPGTRNPQKYDLWAPGVDGVSGNDDDITNWTRN